MTMHPIGVHVGPGLTAENELDDGGPLARAAEMDADGVEVFLTDPQSYKSPKPRPDADALLQLHRPCAEDRSVPISTGARVGVNGPGGDPATYPWRFWITGDRHVSVFRPGRPAGRPGSGRSR